MIAKVLDFLFGKTPDIFDKDGSVRHNLSKETWANWQKRYTNNPEYNWRNHSGTKGGKPENNKQQKSSH